MRTTRRQLIRELGLGASLYRDPVSGIAWVEAKDGWHTPHPSISARGSIRGMKTLGYWGRHDRCVRLHGYAYNLSHEIIDGPFDRIAAEACRCGGAHPA